MSERPIDRWKRLRRVGAGDGVLEVPSVSSGVETGFGPVRFAIGPEGQPRLLVPCGVAVGLDADTSNGRLSVTLSRFTLSGKSALFIDLMSIEPALDAVFAELADEVVHRVVVGRGPLDAVAGTISDFRDLLRDPRVEEVADHQILGLIGELVVLSMLVKIAPGAVEAWLGPYEQRHDFRRREHALEVKTSSRADVTSVSISSIEQLTEPSVGTLVLVHVRVERADKGELSVSALASEIVQCGASKKSLDDGLAAMGCLDSDSPSWNRIHFALEGVRSYRVESGFPRITSTNFPDGTLPDGIGSVTYAVDLRAAQEFLLSDDELESVLGSIAT